MKEHIKDEMKRINVSVLFLLLTATMVIAQYQPGSRLLTVTGGWSLRIIEEGSNSVGGGETGGSFEQTSLSGKWAYGVSLTLVRLTEDVANAKAMYKTMECDEFESNLVSNYSV